MASEEVASEEWLRVEGGSQFYFFLCSCLYFMNYVQYACLLTCNLMS